MENASCETSPICLYSAMGSTSQINDFNVISDRVNGKHTHNNTVLDVPHACTINILQNFNIHAITTKLHIKYLLNWKEIMDTSKSLKLIIRQKKSRKTFKKNTNKNTFIQQPFK